MTNINLQAYRDAWEKLQNEVLDEKTGWGKEELKKRMDKLLIECMAICLKQQNRTSTKGIKWG